MSKDKRTYLSAYIPEAKPKETPKRSDTKKDDRLDEFEKVLENLNDILKKQNRDNLDALYNIDIDNMSSSMRRLFQSYDDGISSAQAQITAWAEETEAGFAAIAEWENETNKSIASITAQTNANTSSIESLTVWKGTVDNGSIQSIASIKQEADANAASIASITQWQSETNQSIASLTQTSNANSASITAFTAWQGETNTTMASISQTASDNEASISQIVRSVGEDGDVTAASIVAAINDSKSSVKISADHVVISGFVTFESLEEDGGSTINGNNISLVSDANGDSMSSLDFYKWRYTDDTAESHTLSRMFSIYTTDNEVDDTNLARFAIMIRTRRARENDEYYATALKLESYGAMSMESGGGMYMSADRYCTIEAIYNTRIVAPKSYADACMDIGYAAAHNSYVFCREGIYYINNSGNASLVVSNT